MRSSYGIYKVIINQNIGLRMLRIALAFSLLYPAVRAWSDPYAWVGYFPVFIQELALRIGVSPTVLLHGFGGVEILLAMWLLLGKNILIPSLATAVLLAGIVVFNLNQFDILFRDVPILIIALFLAQSTRTSSR